MPPPAPGAGNRGVVCLIGGPTATGKTAVACALARRWKSEVVSADSMQVYRGLAVGSAQPTEEETQGVGYHLVGFLDPRERFSAAAFLQRAAPILDRLLAAGRPPLVAGGTGLYLAALQNGLFEQPAIGDEVRQAVQREVDEEGAERAHARLAEVDPEAAARIHPRDAVRIVRALEVYRATGRAISQWRADGRLEGPRYRTALFILNRPRRALYESIDCRVEAMFAGGLIEETQALLAGGDPGGMACLRALGYDKVIDLLAGRIGRPEAVGAVQQSHRNYAKRQLTWLRKMKFAEWISMEGRGPEDAADLIEKSLAPRLEGRG